MLGFVIQRLLQAVIVLRIISVLVVCGVGGLVYAYIGGGGVAGAGELGGLEDIAARTGEAARGALRLLGTTAGPLAPFVAALAAQGFPARYPGSPVLVRAALRPQDRLVCCELHPEDHAAWRAHFARDRQVAVHLRDAYEAIRALTPFPERRGLVLLDPPFEAEDEFGRPPDGGAEFPAVRGGCDVRLRLVSFSLIFPSSADRVIFFFFLSCGCL